MMKTKIALAAMMLSLALSPVDAATKAKKSGAPAKTAVAKKGGGKGKTAKSSKSSKGTKGSKGSKSGSRSGAKSAANAATQKAKKAPVAAAAKPLPSERRQDRSFDSQANQFLGALWRIDPEAAISVGKYDTAAQLTSSTSGLINSARSMPNNYRPSSAPTWGFC